MIQTKNYYSNDTTMVNRSQPMFTDLGYSLDIPWNDIYTTGWQDSRPDTWGAENKLITRADPEYFAPGNIIRSNIIPQINPNDPIYSFDRSKHTYTVY